MSLAYHQSILEYEEVWILRNICYHFVMIFQQALSKKENKGGGGGSPGGDDSDGDIETNLTPRTEAKYNKIDEEFLIHMQHRNHVNGGSRNLQVKS